MTVKEFLKDYITDNPFKQMLLCSKLKREIAQGAKLNAGWGFFIKLIENMQYGQDLTLSISDPLYHPENINRLCSTIMVSDIDKLLKWLDSFNDNQVNVKALLNLFNPTININLSDFPEIHYDKISEVINLQCQKDTGFTTRKIDSKYHVIPEVHLEPTLKACPYNNFKFINDARDCDDFALMTKSWLSQQGLGNITIFYAEINCYDQQPDGSLEFSFAHAVNLAIIQGIYGEFKAEYIEPQSDEIWSSAEPMPWGWGSKIVKLRYLMI